MAAQDTWELAQGVAQAVVWAEGTSADLAASDGLCVSFPARVPLRSTPTHTGQLGPRLPDSLAARCGHQTGVLACGYRWKRVETASLVSRVLGGKEHFVALPLPPSASG